MSDAIEWVKGSNVMTKGIVGGKWRYVIAGGVIWFTEAHNRDWCYIGTRSPEYCRLLAEAHWAGLPENQPAPTPAPEPDPRPTAFKALTQAFVAIDNNTRCEFMLDAEDSRKAKLLADLRTARKCLDRQIAVAEQELYR